MLCCDVCNECLSIKEKKEKKTVMVAESHLMSTLGRDETVMIRK